MLFDCLRTGGSLPGFSYFGHPLLTDSGVFLLVGSQHLALALTSFYVIAVTTRLLWVRFIIAVIWAANPLFYTLAHCVGGETLSMILVLLISATGLRIIRHSHNVPKKEWCLVGILLWLCTLTRHINALLAGLQGLCMPRHQTAPRSRLFRLILSGQTKLAKRHNDARIDPAGEVHLDFVHVRSVT